MAQEHVTVYQLPTEAGTHFAGQRLAPSRIFNGILDDDGGRAASLREALESIGYVVNDGVGLLNPLSAETMVWKSSSTFSGARNEDNALKVCEAIFHGLEALEDIHWATSNNFDVFLGGDCSITPSILAGTHKRSSRQTERFPKIGVLYMDGDVDLTLPRSSDSLNQDGSSMILDSMVMTHLTQRTGGLESMKQFSRPDGSPLVDPSNIVLFGFDPLQPSPEHFAYLLDHGFKCFSRPTVRKDPVAAANAALEWLEEWSDTIVLHFDIDVIDSAEFPLANYPHYAGLHHSEAWEVLKVFLAEKKVRTMIVTEVNPNNDPEGTMVNALVGAITEGMKGRLRHN